MKSVIKENDKKEIIYPCLMIGEHTGVVVLFEKKGVGMVVNNCPQYGIGHYSNEWVMINFKPFNGTIELSNN